MYFITEVKVKEIFAVLWDI